MLKLIDGFKVTLDIESYHASNSAERLNIMKDHPDTIPTHTTNLNISIPTIGPSQNNGVQYTYFDLQPTPHLKDGWGHK